MFRFVALTWNSQSSKAEEFARSAAQQLRPTSGWNVVFRLPGLCVYCTEAGRGKDKAYIIDKLSSVAVGTLFRNGAPSPVPLGEFKPGEALAINASKGQHLVSNFWGRYVAFLRSNDNSLHVIRDPSGTLPCYMITLNQTRLFFSHIDDLSSLKDFAPSINWEYVAAQLALFAVECRETALNGVSQVLGGERLTISNDAIKSEILWKPTVFAQTKVLNDATVAQVELRRAIEMCIRGWASSYDRAILRISGGLDSSIVAGCLATGGFSDRIIGLTYFANDSDGDERKYGRSAAAAAGFPLVERKHDSTFSLEGMFAMNGSPKPTFYIDYLESSRLEAEVAAENKASVIFSGTGGDQLFHQAKNVSPAIDYVCDNGIGTSLLSVAMDTARLARVSIWKTLRSALLEGRSSAVKKRSTVPIQFDTATLSKEVMDNPERYKRFLHPVFEESYHLPPGKASHLEGLIFPVEFDNPLGRTGDPDCVHPLLSQPVIETCLRIPTYLLTQGGWDRALARRAFAGVMPSKILRRRSKGTVEDHYITIYRRNITFIRDVLMSGYLASKGLLDRKKLDGVLSKHPTVMNYTAVNMLLYLGIEIWIQRWTRKSTKAAA